MSFLTEWITNIILFILLALVVDMLLPNSSMQKYAKVVVSLLLMVVIMTPIFRIFSLNIPELIADADNPLFENDEMIKKEIEMKKSEIQAREHAYILEQMAVQMKSVAEGELLERYGLTIKDILLSTKHQNLQVQSEKDLEKVIVTLSKQDSEEVVKTIKPIEIKPFEKEDQQPEELEEKQQIIQELSYVWKISTDKITVELEGGEDER